MLDKLFSWSRTPSSTSTSGASAASADSTASLGREPVHLPDEIILQILSYFPEGEASQGTLWACCLLSRQWHNLAIAKLYAAPHLYGPNFDLFVKTVCPSLNAHIRKSDLAGLVRTLDMSKLAYQGSRATTARLLGRTKNGLEVYVAPQANWGINCLAALSKCTRLRSLDLSLVSEALSYRELSNTIQKMKDLRILKFPRSAAKRDADVYTRSHMHWPPNLEELTLSGDLFDFFHSDVQPLDGGTPNLPLKITRLAFQHSSLDGRMFNATLAELGSKLTFLKLYNLTCSDFDWPYPEGASTILHLCRNLNTLEIAVDLLTSNLIFSLEIEDDDDVLPIALEHQLKHLYIASPTRTGSFIEEELMNTHDLARAVDKNALPALRTVTIEVFFKAPSEWSTADLLLHRRLKRRARENDENPDAAGVRFAVLQAS
ncbi:uncharacterized protein PV09_01879 [Verruconis gallopava]|uniref:F-box domain-containing protein n=1 Tax=Verruconis gallopava TaxID=253628 RepID=A0A0D2ANA2_9PEZI|nr:uncharacterized protein PV09_01879 [Verruconis gallopava]KIW07980.1 hypothetical protein PV09_01879 [Verruconis gallopava]